MGFGVWGLGFRVLGLGRLGFGVLVRGDFGEFRALGFVEAWGALSLGFWALGFCVFLVSGIQIHRGVCKPKVQETRSPKPYQLP